MKRVWIISFVAIFLMAFAASEAPAQSSITTVVTAMDSNSTEDGYIVRTSKGDFEMAYGAGGYGRFGRIFDLVLKSIDKKIPVTLHLGADGIEDVTPVDSK